MTTFPVLAVEYELTEYPMNSGRSRSKGTADCLDTLNWHGFFGERDSFGNVEFDEFSMYAVKRNGVVIAEFHGGAASEAYTWLIENRGYNGDSGCQAWRGFCDSCDKALVDGKCDCEGHADRVECNQYARNCWAAGRNV